MKKRILIACEYSGMVREAFTRRGFDAWSCDFLPTEIPGNHIQGNVLEVLNDGWDFMIAHPPCTYLCNSGVRHLVRDGKRINPERWLKMKQAALFFRKLLHADIKLIGIENPIMHKYAVKIIGRRQDQVLQPWMFGHPEQKATCLWLKNLPKLAATKNVYHEMMNLPDNQRHRVHYLSPGKSRWKERSRTFKGIAEAMAEQWSRPIPEQLSLTPLTDE